MKEKKGEKLFLEEISVSSFVTVLDDEAKRGINGGTEGGRSTTVIRVFCFDSET